MPAAAIEVGFPLPSLLTAMLSAAEPTEERALALQAARGDRAAFAELVRRCQGPVFGLCYRLLNERDAASDAAQESFVRAYASLRAFDPAQPFEVWVTRIARNHCYDLLRKRSLRVEVGEEHATAAPDAAPGAEQQLEAAELSRHLEGALEKLPPLDREILSLYYVQRRKTREIAEIVGVAPGTVMARLFRAREKLRAHLSEVQR